MIDKTDLTVISLAKRSPRSVMLCTIFFAAGGSAFLMISFLTPVGVFWGIWIPFCFLSIPALHHLSRELVQTGARLTELEDRLNLIRTAEQDAPSNRKEPPC